MSLSYVGDLRMKYGAENQNKVVNILSGNYDRIRDLYVGTLNSSKTLKDVVTYNKETETFNVND